MYVCVYVMFYVFVCVYIQYSTVNYDYVCEHLYRARASMSAYIFIHAYIYIYIYIYTYIYMYKMQSCADACAPSVCTLRYVVKVGVAEVAYTTALTLHGCRKAPYVLWERWSK
jgi:hypothetical protein